MGRRGIYERGDRRYASKEGEVLRKVQVSGWRGDRGMPGRVTAAILSSACVLTLSPVSRRGTNSSYWHNAELPLPLREQSAISLSPHVSSVPLPYLLLAPHLPHYHLFPLSTITWNDSAACTQTAPSSSLCSSSSQLGFICMNQRANCQEVVSL